MESLKFKSARLDGSCAFKIDKEMRNRLTVLPLQVQDFGFFAKMLHRIVGLSNTSTSRLRSFRVKLTHQTDCQLPPDAGKPWYLAARLKKPACGMNDAPSKWLNWLDAAVKTTGLLHARADRCTYVSYADTGEKIKKSHGSCF